MVGKFRGTCQVSIKSHSSTESVEEKQKKAVHKVDENFVHKKGKKGDNYRISQM